MPMFVRRCESAWVRVAAGPRRRVAAACHRGLRLDRIAVGAIF